MARNDDNPYDPPELPDIEGVIEGMGGYPQPQWPEDVILPDNKDRMEGQPPVDAAPQQPVPIPPPLPDHIPRPETQPEPETNMDKLDGELLAQNTLIDKAQQAADKIEALYNSRQDVPEIGADAAASLSAISGAVKDPDYGAGGFGGQIKDAIEALRHDSAEQPVVEAQADEVHEAETVPAEGDDASVGNAAKSVFHALGEISGKLKDAIEATQHDAINDDAIIETQADDVYDAETATVEADDDSDPYDSAP
jgi:hypothetical protein